LFAVAKFLFEATKNSFVVLNFVAVTKIFFSVLLFWIVLGVILTNGLLIPTVF